MDIVVEWDNGTANIVNQKYVSVIQKGRPVSNGTQTKIEKAVSLT